MAGAARGFSVYGGGASWEQHGRWPVFGYPITAQAEAGGEGRILPVQWFERDRLEMQADGSVTARPVGADGIMVSRIRDAWCPCAAFCSCNWDVGVPCFVGLGSGSERKASVQTDLRFLANAVRIGVNCTTMMLGGGNLSPKSVFVITCHQKVPRMIMEPHGVVRLQFVKS